MVASYTFLVFRFFTGDGPERTGGSGNERGMDRKSRGRGSERGEGRATVLGEGDGEGRFQERHGRGHRGRRGDNRRYSRVEKRTRELGIAVIYGARSGGFPSVSVDFETTRNSTRDGRKTTIITFPKISPVTVGVLHQIILMLLVGLVKLGGPYNGRLDLRPADVTPGEKLLRGIVEITLQIR